MDITRVRNSLQTFDFRKLFVEELGWSQPATRRAETLQQEGIRYEYRHIAELSGVVVLEITAEDGAIPSAKARAAIYKALAGLYHENLLVFVDGNRTQSLWYWVKREGNKPIPREHLYVKGQPGDLFISKISAMVFDISRFDETGNISIVEVAESLRKALDVERVTKKFYEDFREERLEFTDLIEGIPDERERRWYASVMLHRLMFVYFLQCKGFVDHDRRDYLQANLEASKQKLGDDQYYERFLKPLFFEGFAKPERERTPEVQQLLGGIVYLNGGLFLEHPIEEKHRNIRIPDKAFHNLFHLFGRYTWNLNDTPGGKDDEISPDVLGYIFEKYINQKAFGAYYTRPEITEYLCEHTIHQLILDKVNPTAPLPGLPVPRHYDSLADLLLNLDAPLSRRLLFDVLPSLSLLDPACGSGAFLVAAMKTLINVYSAITGRIEYLNDSHLTEWLQKTRREHRSLNYFIKRTIITNNLFGVDIMEEACEIAKLRLFLALVSSAQSADQLEPLPNIDFNILSGNSLIGLLRVDDAEFNKRNATGNLFLKSYKEVVEEKNRLIRVYRETSTYHRDLQAMRDAISEKKAEAKETLDAILLEEFVKSGIRYEQATWDTANNIEGKPQKRSLTLEDIHAINPLHWGYEFDEVLNRRGGFDAIITNPPWEIFKPNSKEFLMEHSELITKNKMTIKEFEEKKAELLQNPAIREAWLAYFSQFPHVSAYYRSAPQYKNQISVVNDKKAGTDINLYKLFAEQCYNLLRPGGQCGIVLPSGLYTDLGAKQLRELLFGCTRITGLFGFENRKSIFEGVDSRFKFIVLTFAKQGKTVSFPVAFMRHDVAELATFPKRDSLEIKVELIRRLSPDSLSIMEFKDEVDVCIAEKMLSFPLLGEKIESGWNLILTNEFHMTNDSRLFRSTPSSNRLPLYEGKMIHQFTHLWGQPKYWLDETEARKTLLGRSADTGQQLNYQYYRLAFREIASNTNERGMISTLLPKRVFANHKLMLSNVQNTMSYSQLLYCCAALNSFTFDFMVRQRTSTTISMFTFYQLPMPRLTEKDAEFAPIVERAARLICTTPEFDDLAREAGIGSHMNGATSPTERARLRAELDGLVAHLYGLTEEEFAHILTTFPLVSDPVKLAAQNAYRDVQRGLVK